MPISWVFNVVIALACGLEFALASAAPDALERPAVQSMRAANQVLLAVTRAGDRLVAVGERGIIVFSDDNGLTWRQAQVPVSVALTGVRFVSATTGWAVGHGGVVLHTTDKGQTWIRQLDGAQAAELVLKAAESAAQQGGETARRGLAEAWRLVDEGPDKPLLDLWFSDEHNGFVVGAYGLAFATRDGGAHWTSWADRIPNENGNHLYSIRAVGSEVFIAGEQGVLFHSNDGGQHFVQVETPYTGTYFGMLFRPDSPLLLFGLRGNAFRSEDAGRSWQQIDTGTTTSLTDGLRLTDGSWVLVDQAGEVLRSRDQGKTFQTMLSGKVGAINGIAQARDGALVVTGLHGTGRLDVQDNPSK